MIVYFKEYLALLTILECSSSDRCIHKKDSRCNGADPDVRFEVMQGLIFAWLQES